MQKFWHGQPVNRTIQGLASHGLACAPGTVAGGFAWLLTVLRPVYELILKKSRSDKHWHADETGWKVFEALIGKLNKRWFLWIFRSCSTAVFVIDPSRSARVVEEFFGKNSTGIISCDRYRAYFCFVSKSNERFLIAYCWAHVRRDFIALAKDWPIHEEWGMDWVEEIRELYRLNGLRVKHPKESQEFTQCQEVLKKAVNAFKEKADKQLSDTALAEPCRKVLESLNRHWNGLTTFVDHPEVPMDNNTAERGLRGSVVGRKNYYGSGSIESAEFAAIMFTIIQTLLIWGINPQKWLLDFFDFVGGNGSENIDSWLPWNMTSTERENLSLHTGKNHDPPN